MMALTTTAKVKRHIGITSDDDDTLIGELITDAEAAILDYCNGCVFESTDYTEQYDGEGRSEIKLKHWPVQSITSIHDDLDRDFDSTTLIDSSDYVLYADEGIVRLDKTNKTFPKSGLAGVFQNGLRNIQVVYTAGHTSVPGSVARACILLVAAWYNRGTDGGDAVQTQKLGDYNVTYDPAEWPPRVKQLLAPYRAYRI